jgi:hypothetical protein
MHLVYGFSPSTDRISVENRVRGKPSHPHPKVDENEDEGVGDDVMVVLGEKNP